MHRQHLGSLLACLVAAPALAQDRTERVHVCWPVDDSGLLTGTTVEMAVPDDVADWASRDRFTQRGARALDNRLDLVFVGDGYTAGEMGQFHADVDRVLDRMFFYEPFASYRPYFRVTEVEVVSIDSGVDNDPTQGISRNTALDMGYWCSGIERLLCVSTSKAHARARAGAPDVDQVIALANSSKYGGAGYPSSNVGTAAGRNGAAADIVIHELGHSLGNTADEYTYGGPTTWTGGEPGDPNVSIFTEPQQIAQQRKWWRWMGDSNPLFDGPVGTYEGGRYSVFGIYRPSPNSMMRSLGRRFNTPTSEALIREIYREVSPIDESTPTGQALSGGDAIDVVPMQPLSHALDVSWSVNGVDRPDLFGQTRLDLAALGLATGTHTVAVTVVDPTPWVRDEGMRAVFMTEARSWTVVSCRPDLNGDTQLDFFDVSAFLGLVEQGDDAADFNDDGAVNFFDVSAFLTAFANGCD